MSAIYAALGAVMEQVGAVKKQDRNEVQRFMFRGVDAVVNAVYPALVAHGVTVPPNVRSYDYGTVEVGQGDRRKPMGHARVVVEYTFTSAEDGSSVTTSAAGEAMDSGDKATPKAMSVALRTALLQSLMLPTDDPEPDATSYERAAAVDPAVVELNEAKQTVADAWEAVFGPFDRAKAAARYESDYDKRLGDATAAELRAFAQEIRAEASVVEGGEKA